MDGSESKRKKPTHHGYRGSGRLNPGAKGDRLSDRVMVRGRGRGSGHRGARQTYGSGRLNASTYLGQGTLVQEPAGAFDRPHTNGGRGNNHGDGAGRAPQSQGFGFRRLDALYKLSGIQIMEILSQQEVMKEFLCLTDRPLNNDFIVRVVVILGKLAETEFHELTVQLLHQISSKGFMDQLLVFIVKFSDEPDDVRQKLSFDFFSGISAYCHGVIKLLPTLACEKLFPILRQLMLVLDSISFDGKEKVHDLVLITWEKLNMEKERRKSEPVKRSSAIEALQFTTPPNNFRDLSVIPTAEDLHCSVRPFIRPAIIQGPYRNVEHYLDVQFRLLQEDFLRPLREAIKEYTVKRNEIASGSSKNKKVKVNNVKIYERVSLLGVQIEEENCGLCICFDVDQKFCSSINWDHSKRFMLGSLLVLSRDGFQSITLATVLKRNVEELKKGRVLVEICNSNEIDDAHEHIWQMVESTLFFGAYSYVLEALQRFDDVSFPLKEYIVEAESKAQNPRYLTAALHPVFKLPLPNFGVINETPVIEENEEDAGEEVHSAPVHCTSVHSLDTNTWPSAEVMGLDESQYQAFKGAMTQKVMLIQGPPGTGKTFLGLKVASALLMNSSLWTSKVDPRPLIVVCYTNHALDQFLMGLLPITQSIVRVGSGCKEKSLDEYSLYALRKTRIHGRNSMYNMIRGYREKFHELKNEYHALKETELSIEQNCGIIDPETLFFAGVMSERQLWSFSGRDEFMEWLEEGFALKHYHRTLGQNLYISIGVDQYFIVSFPVIDKRIAEETKKSVSGYLLQKKMYLLHQLESPLTKPEKLNINTVNKLRSLYQLSIEQRWMLYRYWAAEMVKFIHGKASSMQNHLLKAASDLKQAKFVEEEEVMSTCQVIGMTTSFAASRQAVLKQLKPCIVIVEEAAEVLEAHVLASLTGSVDHLIMIGDHLQLRPNPAVYELATKYHLNVSMFERLLNNKVQCVSLSTQHRMRPEVAKLICPVIYPHLINHESVLNRPGVRGVTRNVAFIDHKQPQEEVNEIQSYRNVHEADFLTALVRYLLLQGYEASQITVLATYKGQMFHFHKLRQRNSHLENVRITVVDNYQGEENDIILLSLVRSNSDGEVGFLKIENRVCVALSRAKHGLFIIGNMQNMLYKGEIWPKIAKELKNQDALVESLGLKCQVHSTVNEVNCADDFKKVPEGGCLLPCGSLMPCGHVCAQVCHTNDRSHSTYKCHEPCERPVCTKNHKCPDKCFVKCAPCKVPISVELPCGHTADVPCYEDPMLYKCKELVKCVLDPCCHEMEVLCYLSKNPSQIECQEKCIVRLGCGHSCERNCHLLDDPEHELYKCVKPCPRKNDGCSQEHYCKMACHEECKACSVMVLKTLPCGHDWKMQCHEEPSRLLCGNKCSETNACGHKCQKMCKENCDPCLLIVEKILTACGHKAKMQCSQNPADFKLCKNKCDRNLTCGHSCTKKCKEPCSSSSCQELVEYPKSAACGHNIFVPCNQKDKLDASSVELLKYCKAPCNVSLNPCNHKCKGTCGTCWQGRLHQACKEKCGRVLICGHSCSSPCAERCPPCNKPCTVKCQHSECPRRCGEPCVPCEEECPRKCPHQKCRSKCGQLCRIKACREPCKKKLKCQHSCIGLCGDQCICEECNVGIREVFFGTEEDEGVRFVILPECKHIFVASSLEEWLQQGNEIKENVCPKCSTPIRTCVRYNETIMRHALDVQKVKGKIFGHPFKIMGIGGKVERDLQKVPACFKENKHCSAFLTKIRSRISTLTKQKQRGKLWYKPPLSLSEITNLDQFCQIVLTLGNIMKKVFERRIIFGPCEKRIMYDLKEEFKIEFTLYVENFVIDLMKRDIVSLSNQEVTDMDMVLKRLDSLVMIGYIESSPNFRNLSESSKELYSLISGKVRGCGPYTQNEYTANKKSLKSIGEEIKCTITPCEIRAIVSAMSMGKGHWFKCPNGHIYAIGDCGGATMESKCNECGARIGGGGHRLRSDNTFAPEMDGAAAPAWPPVLV